MTAIIKLYEDDYDFENVKEHPIGTLTLKEYLKLYEAEIQYFDKVYVTDDHEQILSEDKDFLFDKPQVYRVVLHIDYKI